MFVENILRYWRENDKMALTGQVKEGNLERQRESFQNWTGERGGGGKERVREREPETRSEREKENMEYILKRKFFHQCFCDSY